MNIDILHKHPIMIENLEEMCKVCDYFEFDSGVWSVYEDFPRLLFANENGIHCDLVIEVPASLDDGSLYILTVDKLLNLEKYPQYLV